jgi:hypothetical protein
MTFLFGYLAACPASLLVLLLVALWDRWRWGRPDRSACPGAGPSSASNAA